MSSFVLSVQDFSVAVAYFKLILASLLNFLFSNGKFERLGGPLDEIVTISVHKFSIKCHVIIWRRDVIREL